MRVLIACEFSGVVRDAFTALGHDAMSCDLLPTERPGPHYQGDVRDVLGDGWGMMVAHPPCTYLSGAGAHLWKHRWAEIDQAAAFFRLLLCDAPIPCVAVENPQGWMNTHFRKPDQTINPWMFGESYKKRTCLWLRGLPPLMASCQSIERAYWVDSSNARRHNDTRGHRNQRERSRTFAGVAVAMAQQWGGLAVQAA